MQAIPFHPAIARWFQSTFESPTEPQVSGWPAIQSGAHTLIAAPTGSGKTLAAFLSSLDGLFQEGLNGTLRNELHVLYVSPLKALSNDIHKNLQEPLAAIRASLLANEGRDIAVRAEVRTGDTSAGQRLAIAKNPPHILVTTPESFYLLLTSQSGRRMLGTVRTLIVDEIHAVVGNRRGTHLALSIERLQSLVQRPLQRIGLSATQKPLDEVARFLVGTHNLDDCNQPLCTVVDSGHKRAMDLSLELPGSPLEAVMSNEVWTEVYARLSELIESHRTTLVFVNTRRLAERVTAQLCERLGKDRVTSHHGSLSAKLRLDAENRLKNGELKALVATSSLELGIDIGSVDLVCQLGTTRSISTLLQRVGRAEHRRSGLPKGRLFPLTRDELLECTATLRAVRRGELDRLQIPLKPLDILSQQIVATVACEDCDEERLFEMMRSAYPYAALSRVEFDEVISMLANGFSTKRGRRGALIHHDAVNHRVRARRGARLTALTSGGAIPDNADYRVVVEPTDTFIGSVNEDFAVESMAGDIFQLGNASWKILRIQSGTVRVEDAHGQPPGIPFWLGEGPARTAELSAAVSSLRAELEERVATPELAMNWLLSEAGIPEAAARQLVDYARAGNQALGVIPSQDTLVMERFFDESGGMQLVIHSLFGARLNRAWGLALRKRFCRAFNFELQAAATDDAIVLSLGTQHSFPLEEVFRYLNSNTVRDLLVQALLDAPMFPIRWRWNATRSLALPRQRNGHKVPPPLLRMDSENLLAAVFPDQLACLENIAGDRAVPNHPLVKQTIEDCLTEAMDIESLQSLLRRIEMGEIRCIARDLPEPSLFAHEILNARPYAFLDNAPLEERRTQAVYTRRAGESSTGDGLGILDPAAIDKVCSEAWPQSTSPDELHEALLLLGVMGDGEVERCTPDSREYLRSLSEQRRAGRFECAQSFWVAAERLSMVQTVYPDGHSDSSLDPSNLGVHRNWERAEALLELVRGRMEFVGPVSASALAEFLHLPQTEIDAALLALEAEGFVLRGKFHSKARELEWCDRRLLARIHRLTLNRLRAEIQPASLADFQRFLLAWQHVSTGHQSEGPGGVEAVLDQLDGYELPAASWEPDVLARRVKDYDPQWLDRLCFTGRMGWGRLSPPQNQNGRPFTPVRSSPISLFSPAHLKHWLELSEPSIAPVSSETSVILKLLSETGALFFADLVRQTGLLPSRVEQSLGELVAHGWVTADGFEGLRALLIPSEKRFPFSHSGRKPRHKAVTSVEFAGRWSLLRKPLVVVSEELPEPSSLKEEAKETFARCLLRRYGVIFRRLLERENLKTSWYELSRIYRHWEAVGEIRGGYFVQGVSGEQFALPEAVGLLRSLRKASSTGDLTVLSAADPLNLIGILTPGPRIAAIPSNRLLLKDGIPVAGLEAGEVIDLDRSTAMDPTVIEHLLKVGNLPGVLRPYYA